MTNPAFQPMPMAPGAQPVQGPYPGQPGQVPQQFVAPQPNVPQTQVLQPEHSYQSAPPQFPAPQQQVDPRAPQYAPAWVGGQQQFPGQQPQQPQQPQRQPDGRFAPQQPAPAQGIQFDQQGRMFGPGIPQELQGKTMTEAIGLYGVMRQSYVQTQAQPQRPQAQPQGQPVQQPQAPQQQPGQRPSFWSDPEGTLDRMLDQRLAPILQQSQEQSIEGARNTIAQMHPQHFAQYEGEIYARLNGLPPETLANPRAWQLALEQVIGEKAMAGQFNPGQAPQGSPNQQGFVQMAPPQQGQPQAQPQYQAPMPQLQPAQYPRAVLPWERAQQPQTPQPFFSESPSAGVGSGFDPNAGANQLSPAQNEVARRMGLSPAQYVQGMGARY